MTTQLPSKKRLEQYISSPLEHGLTRSEQMELARFALAAMEQKPVFFIEIEGDDWINSGRIEGKERADLGSLPAGINELYAAPVVSQPAPSIPAVPVSVPDELSDKSFWHIANKFQVSMSEAQWILVGWNACRAAMLHHSE